MAAGNPFQGLGKLTHTVGMGKGRGKSAPAKPLKSPSKSKPNAGFDAIVGYFNPPKKSASHLKWYESYYSETSQQDMEVIIGRFKEVVATLKGATPAALEACLLPTFELSQYYVPYDKGDLQQSGQLVIDTSKSTPRAVISYGNDSVRYAAIVHERVDLFHQPPTQAKYLQRAMEETVDDVKNNFIALMKRSLGED